MVNTGYPVCSIVLDGGPVFALDPLRGQGSRRVVLADERQHAWVAAGELVVRAEAEDRVALPDLDHPPGPVQQRLRVTLLRLDVERLVAVDGVHDRRQVQALRVAAGEGAGAVRRP